MFSYGPNTTLLTGLHAGPRTLGRLPCDDVVFVDKFAPDVPDAGLVLSITRNISQNAYGGNRVRNGRVVLGQMVSVHLTSEWRSGIHSIVGRLAMRRLLTALVTAHWAFGKVLQKRPRMTTLWFESAGRWLPIPLAAGGRHARSAEARIIAGICSCVGTVPLNNGTVFMVGCCVGLLFLQLNCCSCDCCVSAFCFVARVCPGWVGVLGFTYGRNCRAWLLWLVCMD